MASSRLRPAAEGSTPSKSFPALRNHTQPHSIRFRAASWLRPTPESGTTSKCFPALRNHTQPRMGSGLRAVGCAGVSA